MLTYSLWCAFVMIVGIQFNCNTLVYSYQFLLCGYGEKIVVQEYQFVLTVITCSSECIVLNTILRLPIRCTVQSIVKVTSIFFLLSLANELKLNFYDVFTKV